MFLSQRFVRKKLQKFIRYFATRVDFLVLAYLLTNVLIIVLTIVLASAQWSEAIEFLQLYEILKIYFFKTEC